MRYTPTAPSTAECSLQVAPAPPAPAAPTQPAPPAAGRVSLGGIKKKETCKTTKSYPAFPADNPTKDVADWLIEHMPIVDQVDTTKKQLIEAVVPFYFTHAHGRAEVESSVSVAGHKGELLLVFPKQLCGAATEDALRPTLGARLDTLFRRTFEIKVDGDKVPADNAQALINELVELFAKHGASDALTSSEKFVPQEIFHTQRHTLLTVEENLALNGVARIKASLKIRK